MLTLLFWLSLAAIVYHHLGYPVLLRAWARLLGNDSRPAVAADDARASPSVTLIVPARNEAKVIAAKVENLGAMNCPPGGLKLVLALDGCEDATEHVARGALAGAVPPFAWDIVTYGRRMGKVAVLNDQIAAARSDLVALSDASAIVAPDALVRAAAHFQDPSIGVVCGTYRPEGSAGETAYWRYQTELKALEARVAAPMGAHGAFYMFRRDLWSPLPLDTINDDFVLPMSIVAQGYRALYDQSIVIGELERSGAEHAFRRRIRLGAGALQQVLRTARLARPSDPSLAFVFLSGKGLRAIMPLIMLVCLVASLGLAWNGSLLHGAITAAALGGAGLGVLTSVLPRRLPWWAAAPAYAINGYAAAGLGVLLIGAGLQARVWRMTDTAPALWRRSIGGSRVGTPAPSRGPIAPDGRGPPSFGEGHISFPNRTGSP